MPGTDFFVAALGPPVQETLFKTMKHYCSADKQTVVRQIIGACTKSTLLLVFADDTATRKNISKTFFLQFAEGRAASSDSYTQYSVSFVDEASCDLVHYRCDRLYDIDAVLESEDMMYTCSSVCATTVVPSDTTFDFMDFRFTVMMCTGEDYDGEAFSTIVETAAASVGCKFTSICAYFPEEALCTLRREKLVRPLEELQHLCGVRDYGRDERVSSQLRLQDARSWSLRVLERHHFAPMQPGPYLVSLNPQFTVGEKLVHYICEEISTISADTHNASAQDFIVLPPSLADDVEHFSVYSPHCRLTRDGNHVRIKPECGMTFINGSLLSGETELVNNDRLILGKQLAFRFVMVEMEAPRTTESRILDWELCSKEFREKTTSVLTAGTNHQLERDNRDLHEWCSALEDQISRSAGDAWIILSTPPPDYTGELLWPCELSKAYSHVTVGPEGTIKLPFLRSSAGIHRVKDKLQLKVPDTGADMVETTIVHGSRFVIDGYTFTVSLSRLSAPRRVLGEKVGGGSSEEALKELRLSLFDLQWALALLFDFAFPPPAHGTGATDEYAAQRSVLCNDSILTNDKPRIAELIALNGQLTQAIRAIGSGLAKEINGAAVGLPYKERNGSGDGEVSADLTAFLEAAKNSQDLSPLLLKRFNEEVGKVFSQPQPATKGPVGGRASPSAARSPSPQNPERPSERTIMTRLAQLKGTCLIAAPEVTRRMGDTVNILSVSANPRALWEKYVKVLDTITKPSTKSSSEPSTNARTALLPLVDVLLSTDYCLKKGTLSVSDVAALEANVDEWQVLADRCAAAYGEVMEQKRNAWHHDAAVQRKPTPRIRPAAVKPKGGATTKGASSPRPATAAGRLSRSIASPRGPATASKPRPPPPAKLTSQKDASLRRSNSANYGMKPTTSFLSAFSSLSKTVGPATPRTTARRKDSGAKTARPPPTTLGTARRSSSTLGNRTTAGATVTGKASSRRSVAGSASKKSLSTAHS